jgi:hypothetical protein
LGRSFLRGKKRAKKEKAQHRPSLLFQRATLRGLRGALHSFEDQFHPHDDRHGNVPLYEDAVDHPATTNDDRDTDQHRNEKRHVCSPCSSCRPVNYGAALEFHRACGTRFPSVNGRTGFLSEPRKSLGIALWVYPEE